MVKSDLVCPLRFLHYNAQVLFLKGWTCCGRKTTDFTEFLNTPGCEKGRHSNVKPEEPESITGKVGDANDMELPQVEEAPVRESLESRVKLERPSFEKTPLKRLKPVVAASLTQQMKNVVSAVNSSDNANEKEDIPVGESCKNGGCKEVSYSRFIGALFRLQPHATLSFADLPRRGDSDKSMLASSWCSSVSRGSEILVLLPTKNH